jgi:hypothetical protein
VVAEQRGDPPRRFRCHPCPEDAPLVTQLAAIIEGHTGIARGLAPVDPFDLAFHLLAALALDPLRTLGPLGALALDALRTLGLLDALTLDPLRALGPLGALALDMLRTFGPLSPRFAARRAFDTLRPIGLTRLLGTLYRGLAVVFSFLGGRRSRQGKRGTACNPDHPGHVRIPVMFIIINGAIWGLAPDRPMNRPYFALVRPHFVPKATRL